MAYRSIIEKLREKCRYFLVIADTRLTSVMAPVSHTLMQYSRNEYTQRIVSAIAPIVMATNATPPLLAMYHHLSNPDCKSNVTNDEAVIWTVTAFISAASMRSNYRKFQQSALSYMQHYYRVHGAMSAPIVYLDCACDVLATVITAFANSASLGSSVFSNICLNNEEDTIAREVSVILFCVGVMMQMYLLMLYYQVCRSRGAAWDMLAAGAYSIPNTAQYMLPLMSNVVELSTSERVAVALLYAVCCLGTTVQYYRNLQKDARYQEQRSAIVTEAIPLMNSSLAIGAEANHYFFKKGLHGNALALLVMGISVAVKSMAGWKSLEKTLERYLPDAAIIMLNTVFAAYVYSAAQFSRALEVA